MPLINDILNGAMPPGAADEVLKAIIETGFAAGFALGSLLHILGYGVFRALALLNIKK